MPYDDVMFKLKHCGKNVYIGQNVYIRYPEEFECGDNIIIDDGCVFTTRVKLGNHIHICPTCTVIGGKGVLFTMDDFATMSAGCRIVCVSDDYLGSGLISSTIPDYARCDIVSSNITLGKHAILGTNTVVLPNAQIGEGVATGAMTLVTRTLDPWGLYYGIPAVFHKERPRDVILAKEMVLKQREGWV